MAAIFKLRQARKACKLIIPVLLCCFLAHTVNAITGIAICTVYYQPSNESNTTTGAYAEVVWQADPRSLIFQKNAEGKLTAKIKADIVVYNEESIIAEEHYLLNTKPQSGETASTQIILDMKRLKVPPGTYKLNVSLSEPALGGKPFVYEDSIKVRGASEGAFYSGTGFVDTFIANSDIADKTFFRNGGLMLPMATNFIDEYRSSVHFYTELYQTKTVAPDRFPLIQHSYVSRKINGVAIAKLQRYDTLKEPAAMIPLRHAFDITKLSSGGFYVNVELLDNAGETITTNLAYFQLFNTRKEEEPARDTSAKQKFDTSAAQTNYFDLSKTFVAKYTLTQCKNILEMIYPGADPLTQKAIDNLMRKPEEMYIRYFIYNYFVQVNRSAPEKAWNELADKVKEVNRLFGAGSEAGYRTERGMLYLKYGKPSDRVIVNNEPGALPYEVWQYYAIGKRGQEGVFLFYQPGSSVNDFKLLHSNVPGETKNPNWRAILYANGNSSTNSQAEQYIRNR